MAHRDQTRTRYGIVPWVEVSFDDFTEDIEPNRLLRAAIHRLLNLPVRSDRSRWPLRAIEARLGNVRLVEYDRRRVPQVTFDRRSEHDRGAVGLARLVLPGVSFDLGAGGVAASAFLIDMNKVFEDFVVVALRDALGVSDRVLVQGASGKQLFLGRGERIRLKRSANPPARAQGGRCRVGPQSKLRSTGCDAGRSPGCSKLAPLG